MSMGECDGEKVNDCFLQRKTHGVSYKMSKWKLETLQEEVFLLTGSSYAAELLVTGQHGC